MTAGPDIRPAHAPYTSGNGAFSIGLRPLGDAPWIEPDGELAFYLAEKRRLLELDRDEVWGAERDTLPSQFEIRDALATHLLSHPSGIWTREGNTVSATRDGAVLGAVDIRPDDPHPLLSAALLVQEDLCLMRKGEGGWRLAAGSVSFASSWSFAAKFGQTLDGLHEPVPGYADRLAVRMARIFDSLRADVPVVRLNWSLYGDGELRHPHVHGPMRFARDARSAIDPDGLFVRVERQTLTKMSESGDILFTIRIHRDPISAFSSHPDRARLASGLRAQVAALDNAQLAYKGLVKDRVAIDALLQKMAG
ncbi:heme-dependent oxidative N-demethylase family protein [Tepidamorphus sp. 3E244]|uniref:heme-dependent oxidative N-demethylase family protein n=1 Tax=Tepidamorphus sp. 3E244 TaxID=3385498 RepID=UPI0038FBE81E